MRTRMEKSICNFGFRVWAASKVWCKPTFQPTLNSSRENLRTRMEKSFGKNGTDCLPQSVFHHRTKERRELGRPRQRRRRSSRWWRWMQCSAIRTHRMNQLRADNSACPYLEQTSECREPNVQLARNKGRKSQNLHVK
jgi:hypothetical protein